MRTDNQKSPRAPVFTCAVILCFLTAALSYSQADARASLAGAKELSRHISWLGQSSIRIEAEGKILYVDPIRARSGDKADIILITHLHDDHYQASVIRELMKEGTVVVSPRRITIDSVILKPGESTDQHGIRIEAVPAYNLIKTSFHPQSAANNGYVITVGGIRVYHAGDTERIPEMKDVRCDIALVPLGQTYTFGSVDEAVEAVMDTQALIAIPIHYGQYEGTAKDAREFAARLKKRGVVAYILKSE